MPPPQDRRGRGPVKRPRPAVSSSSREELPVHSVSSTNYVPATTPTDMKFNQPPPKSSSGTDPTASSTAASSGSQSMTHRVNIIRSNVPPGKVAIPPLRPPHGADASQRGGKRGRTSHACDCCRRAKAGCSGEQPCTRCRAARLPCVYGDGKRDRDRKRMKRLGKERTALIQHNSNITGALRRIQFDGTLSHVQVKLAIDNVLAMTPPVLYPNYGEDSLEAASGPSSSDPEELEPEEREQTEEFEVDDIIGSTRSLDVINVDTDRDDTRATGHMGKSSSVSWTKRTAEECLQNINQDPGLSMQEIGFTQSSYHVEDADVEHMDTSNVNPYEWPEHNLADALVRLYFDHSHDAFPVLDKASFMATYQTFQRGSSDITPSELIWLGSLNAIFAIGAVFAHLTNIERGGRHDDHLIYCARAKILCLDRGLLYQDARVSTTCALGLMALYYLSTCRLNRAWTICGLAIRHALTLGLHVRSEVDGLSDVDKEHRVRLWWSLYSIEVLLNELTGRPSCIADRDISTPLPINIDEREFLPGQPLYERNDLGQKGSSGRRNSTGRPSTYQTALGSSHQLMYPFPALKLPVKPSSYFIYRTQLSIISHEIVTQLYCATTTKEKWADVQETISRIDSKLLAWRDSLPKEFDIQFDTWPEPDWNDPYSLPRTGLAMLFNSSRMILFRPCLCRFEGTVDKQSEKSKDFNQLAVEICVRSARKMISLLTWSAKSAQKLYAIPPWWNTLHYLCKALSVLMLEMAFKAQHLPRESAYILEDAKKGVNWLAMMAQQSVAARKAWEIFDKLIRFVAPMIKWSVFDMPTEAPVPPGYNWLRFITSKSSYNSALPASRLPQNQLSEGNLHQYKASQPSIPNSAATIAWTNKDAISRIVSSSSLGAHASYEQLASNPLDQVTAVERFSNLGHLHGHYDDPWQQLFNSSSPHAPSMNMAAAPRRNMNMHAMDISQGEGGGVYYNQSGFVGDAGAYETMSPTNAGFGQGGGGFSSHGSRGEEGDRRSGFAGGWGEGEGRL